MLQTVGIVDACFRSKSDRAKASRRLGGKWLLEWVARRVTDCPRLDGVIVCTLDDPENAFVVERTPLDIPVFVGRQKDPLGCTAAALEKYAARGAVRISASSAFVDPVLIDRLVTAAEEDPNCDYMSYRLRDGRPAVLSPVCLFAEWVRSSALREAARKAGAPEDRSHPTRYIYSRPDKFNVRLIPAPAAIDRDDVRLTVDIEEDWDIALSIVEALGPDALDWQRIADLLDHQPALRSRMAALNRVHAVG